MKKIIQLSVNGELREVAVRPSRTLLDVLREDLGLTGTKNGCGLGDCGCCTVLMDGEPVNSCLVLAVEAQGHEVLTIEGLAENGDLHPLQKSVITNGAIQCGFCTPGMIMSAKALVDRTAAPNREEIKEALAGNLCRCTGYAKIIEAVEHWSDYADGRAPDLAGEYRPERVVVGKRVPRIDAPEKATGQAVFADDVRLGGMLYGKLLHSPHAHARVLSVNTEQALALEGVKAVITGADVPDTKYGVSPARYDEHVLVKDKVRHVGDAVAAVAALDEETCHRALDLIEVEYDVLPAVFDPHEAMADGAPQIHDEESRFKNNVNTRVDWHFGDVESGFAAADCVREATFVGNRVYQSPMEPHCAVSTWDHHGRLTIYTTTQVAHYVQYQLARLLELPRGDIRVVMTKCGGGFGGKAEMNKLEICSALLARITGRPVKMRFSREEMHMHCRGRHKQTVTMKIGAKKDGTITAVEEKAVLEGGAYSSFGVVAVYYAGAMIPTLYKLPAFAFEGFRTYTNTPACGAMRGHGCPHPRFAFESLLDMIAADLGIDPIDIRKRNAMEPDTRTVNDLEVHSCEFKACLDTVRDRSGWDEKRGKLPYGRGVGIGCGGFVSGAGYAINREENDAPHSSAVIRIAEDGMAATLLVGDCDIGQGSDTVLCQIAAEAMGIGYERMKIVAADTDLTPRGFGSYSSRVTLMGGNAAKMAGEEIRTQVLEAAAGALEVPVSALDSRGNRVFVAKSPEVWMPWEEAARARFAVSGPLVGRGHYHPPKSLGGPHKGATVGTSPAYSFGACVAEVEVDPETGKVKVLKFTDAHDLGTAVNPMAVEGQAEGAVVMMQSESLYENMLFGENGELLNPNLHEYLIATAMDAPEIDSTFVESFEPQGPYGAKEVGEGATLPVIGAIANAIHDAVGVRIHEIPITPDRLLAAIKQLREEES